MAEPFLSEIRAFSFGFAPKGWALCNGQLMPINQNQALFALLGTTFGGNGQTTFALPNLQGRVPIHMGAGHNLGEAGGEQAHTLTINEIPEHSHNAMASSSSPETANPSNNFLTKTGSSRSAITPYGPLSSPVALASGTSSTGGSQPHQNMQPFLVLNFAIALQGIFPSQN